MPRVSQAPIRQRPKSPAATGSYCRRSPLAGFTELQRINLRESLLSLSLPMSSRARTSPPAARRADRETNGRTFAWILVRRRLNINGDLPPMNTQRLLLKNDAGHVTTTFRNRRSGSIHPRSRSHLGTRHRYQVARRASATLASDNDLVDRLSRVPPGRGCRRIPPSLHLIARGSAARYGIRVRLHARWFDTPSGSAGPDRKAPLSGCTGPPSRPGDRWFESCSLQRRVNCERDLRGLIPHRDALRRR
jgi:hypothetical protein